MRTVFLILASAVSLAAQTIQVSGRVLANDGKPIEGARVVWDGKPPMEAKTDSQGSFVIEAPAERERHGFMVTRAGFMSTSFSQEGRTSVLVHLSPTGSITGRVLDAYGNPVPSARVTPLRRSRYERGRRSLLAASFTVTADADGIYTFQSLPPGRYYLRVEAKAPAVTTYYPSTLDVVIAAAVDIEAGATRSGVDIRQLVAPVFRVRGKVVDESGTPVGNAPLYIATEPAITNSFIRPVPSASDGSFEFGGLLPDRYTIWTEPEGAEQPKYIGRVSVAVAREDVDNVRLVVNQGFSFSGFISMDDGTAIPPGPSMSTAEGKTVEIPLLGLNDVERESEFRPMSISRSEGTFRVDNVPPGKYRFSFHPPERIYVKSIKLGSRDIHGPLDLSYGSLDNARIVLGSGAGQVHALVRDRNGQAMAGAFVVLWPEPLNPHPGNRPFFGLVNETDENGITVFDILPPGKYLLAAFVDADRIYLRSLDFLEYFQGRALSIDVGTNGAVERTLEPISREEAAAVIRNLP